MKHIVILEDNLINADQVMEVLNIAGGIATHLMASVPYWRNSMLRSETDVANEVVALRARQTRAENQGLTSILIVDLASHRQPTVAQMHFGFRVIHQVAALSYLAPHPVGLPSPVERLLQADDYRIVFMTAEASISVLDPNTALRCAPGTVSLLEVKKPGDVQQFLGGRLLGGAIPWVQRIPYRDRLMELVQAWML